MLKTQEETKFFINIVLVSIILGVLFYLFPEVDLMVSSFFYSGEAKFTWKEHLAVEFLDYGILVAIALFFIVCAYNAIITLIKVKSLHLRNYTTLVYAGLASILGPLLLVRILKRIFGRARPYQVEEFGGDSIFSPAFSIANQCMQDCSFVSGHAAAGFMFFIIGFMYSANGRRRWHLFATTTGILFGLSRIVSGRHFLSDVLFSGIVIYITAYIMANIILGSKR